jgi:hypothetical protein
LSVLISRAESTPRQLGVEYTEWLGDLAVRPAALHHVTILLLSITPAGDHSTSVQVDLALLTSRMPNKRKSIPVKRRFLLKHPCAQALTDDIIETFKLHNKIDSESSNSLDL